MTSQSLLRYECRQCSQLLSEQHAAALRHTPCSQAAWRAQIEIGQLDDTIGISEVPFGNLSYWFQGSSIVLSIQLNQGMFYPLGSTSTRHPRPLGRRPPSRTARQGASYILHPSRCSAPSLDACKVYPPHLNHGKCPCMCPAMLCCKERRRCRCGKAATEDWGWCAGSGRAW